MPTTPCLLTAAARMRPEAPAAVSPEGTLTYREYNELAAAVAKGLGETGLTPGAVLGISGPRSVEWLPLLMGCFRAGVAAFPINTHLSPQAIQSLLDGCDAHFTISQTTPPTPPQAGGKEPILQ
ncbi:MAG: AMP-binding protein, partial [FCB group bacterium]|nr:AMP-binding protein [FCB group bacterium]